jgi:hypothetical protein
MCFTLRFSTWYFIADREPTHVAPCERASSRMALSYRNSIMKRMIWKAQRYEVQKYKFNNYVHALSSKLQDLS